MGGLRKDSFCVVYSMGFDKCSTLINVAILVQYVILSLPPKSYILPIHPSPPFHKLLATTKLFIISIVLPCPECLILEIMQFVAFLDWPLSLKNTHFCFLHGFS